VVSMTYWRWILYSFGNAWSWEHRSFNYHADWIHCLCLGLGWVRVHLVPSGDDDMINDARAHLIVMFHTMVIAEAHRMRPVILLSAEYSTVAESSQADVHVR
jgi:hypothetical protein